MPRQPRLTIALLACCAWAQSLASEGFQRLPEPVLTALVAQNYSLEPQQVESVRFAPNNPMILGFSESYRLVIAPQSLQASYATVEIITCTNQDPKDQAWICTSTTQWRIQVGKPVYIQTTNESIRGWIDASPEVALRPYVALVEHAKQNNPEDRFGAPPSHINIGPEEKTLIYSQYGSHCETSYEIKSLEDSGELKFQLVLASAVSLCI